MRKCEENSQIELKYHFKIKTLFDDEKIMQKVKDGQLSALTDLFERYNVPLYNFFLKLTMESATSEDLTQNLFYRVIRYRHTFNAANGSFKSWLYQMARNLHADHCKQRQRNTEVVKNTDTLPDDVADRYPEYRLRENLDAVESGQNLNSPTPMFPDIQPKNPEVGS